MNDYLLNPEVCPSSLDENDEPIDPNETAHKWDGENCAECGATRNTAFKCPLCTANVYHKEQDGTHIYSCTDCPFLALEWYTEKDTDALTNYLKQTP